MSTTQRQIPWSELSALLAAWVSLTAWTGHRAAIEPAEAGLVALFAIGTALLPRRARRGPSPVMTEAAAVAGALSALAIATTVGGDLPTSPLLRKLQALAVGDVLGVSTLLALSLPMETRSLRWAAIPAVLVAALAVYGLWPTAALWVPGVRLFPAFAAIITGLFYVHAVTRPMPALDRARQILPGLGAGAMAGALLFRAWWGPSVSPLVLALGLLAQTAGLTLGTGAIALDHAARFARRAAAAAAGIAAGVVMVNGVPTFPYLGVVGAGVVMGLVWPLAERRLRPDEGRLLDACKAIVRSAPKAETLTDLAAAVLDPLRLAARNLRAPAALWVLDRAETLRVDVTGAAMPAPLSLESERALLGWLRSRKTPVFADLLRPFVVRRAELRPVLAALDAHEAIGALPLVEDGELSGVVLLPRGARDEVVTYEEITALSDAGRVVEGILARLSALDRAQHRLVSATVDRDTAVASADHAEKALTREIEARQSPAMVSALGSYTLSWVAYAPAMRALEARIERASDEPTDLWIVAEPGLSPIALAARIHQGSTRRSRSMVHVACASWKADDLLAGLVGDGRVAPLQVGWLAQCEGGTLVLEDPTALGHDVRVTLADALTHGSVRRLGETEAQPIDVRLIVVSRYEPMALDLPKALLQRFEGNVLRLPPLRERREDLDSLTFLAVDRACRLLQRAPLGVDAAALAVLRSWPWPGNVDELTEAITYAVEQCRGSRIGVDHLPPTMRAMVRSSTRYERESGRRDDA